MKRRIALAPIAVAAMLLMSGCSSASAEQRAEETALSYMDVNLGFDTETDVSSFACDGVELRVDGDGTPASKPDDEGTDSSIVVHSVTQNDDGLWVVDTEFMIGGGVTPSTDIIVSADGDCIVKGR